MPLAVCATPIGNLADVTLRVLDELRSADVVLCEDTRRTQVLLDRHGIRARRLVSLHRHNERRRVSELLPPLLTGERHALVSDAGLPGVNDPGGRLVVAALDAGVPVTVLPGPSAVETALVASGLEVVGYRFLGYLPRREAELVLLWEEARTWPYAAVAFESPRRLPRALATLARIDPARPIAVCRELTKRFEEVVRGTALELAGRFDGPVRGEVTLVLSPGQAVDAELSEAVASVRRLVAAGASRREAVDVVAGLAHAPRNALYRASLDRAD
ncbi:16S rRNA (cytidine(1402)-2'-O)-methyltransferase [Gaiella sp.]|jgi:16S rRNA (cytidine1402-2'-O)-methyltransferase|uniref:16S rRNA (cytidine(1402)-2'-O)-methyltransferase n=1 Tax=Gaiella sp. TaxID=2663207 RepID=UPI002E3391A8|nr:16S rRNA (cytidine(1402)-2'-O)-methyltransferase [Gaiella sp.]HEX5584708.1 16S rRNA (cytidine(1402)-2'-O)-methyltransferase [Gaiella sp.]